MPFNLKRKCIIAIASLSLLSSVQAQGELSLVIGAVEKTQNEATQISLLKGIVIGLRGLKGIPAPKAWNALRTKLLSSNNVELKRITQQLSQQFGSEEAMQDALALVFNKKAHWNFQRACIGSKLKINVLQQEACVLPCAVCARPAIAHQDLWLSHLVFENQKS